MKPTLQDEREDIQFSGISDCRAALPLVHAVDRHLDGIHHGLMADLYAALRDEETPGAVVEEEVFCILLKHREGCTSLKCRLVLLVRFVGRQLDRFLALNRLGCREAELAAAELTLTEKVCSGAECPFYGVAQPLANFPRERSKKCGHGNLCFTCKRADNRKRRLAKQDPLAAAARAARDVEREERAG